MGRQSGRGGRGGGAVRPGLRRGGPRDSVSVRHHGDPWRGPRLVLCRRPCQLGPGPPGAKLEGNRWWAVVLGDLCDLLPGGHRFHPGREHVGGSQGSHAESTVRHISRGRPLHHRLRHRHVCPCRLRPTSRPGIRLRQHAAHCGSAMVDRCGPPISHAVVGPRLVPGCTPHSSGPWPATASSIG